MGVLVGRVRPRVRTGRPRRAGHAHQTAELVPTFHDGSEADRRGSPNETCMIQAVAECLGDVHEHAAMAQRSDTLATDGSLQDASVM
jgi:hypothetical protein